MQIRSYVFKYTDGLTDKQTNKQGNYRIVQQKQKKKLGLVGLYNVFSKENHN